MNELVGPLSWSVLSFTGGVYKSGALDKFDMVWLYRTPIQVGRRGDFTRSNDFYLPSPRLEEGMGVSTLCSCQSVVRTQEYYSKAYVYGNFCLFDEHF
jgi:hypothetical protein